MGKTRSVLRKKKYDDAYNRKTIKPCDNGGVAPWSDLTDDVLLLVMMKLGVVDFLAFSRVCKSWRSLTVSNRKEFIVSKPPMSISISTHANEKVCYLEDLEGRKLKTILPNLADRICVGVTCGYLILFDEKRKDFWLVNPITRHELHFPALPYDDPYCLEQYIKATLIFSPSISGWVFVVFPEYYYHEIWFCIAGKREWRNVYSHFSIDDFHAFMGKMYTAHYVNESDEIRVCEMKLYPKPELVLLETESFPKPNIRFLRFVSYGENLYVIDMHSEHPYKIHELDLDEMKWVSREKTGKEYTFFLKYGVEVTDAWVDTRSLYMKDSVTGESLKSRLFYANMWYFFHDCLNVNLLHE